MAKGGNAQAVAFQVHGFGRGALALGQYRIFVGA